MEALGAQEAQQQPLPPGRLDAAGEYPLPLGGTRGRPGEARMASCAGRPVPPVCELQQRGCRVDPRAHWPPGG